MIDQTQASNPKQEHPSATRTASRYNEARQQLIERANQVLRCAAGDREHFAGDRRRLFVELDKLIDLAMDLKSKEAFGHARRLLARINDQAPADWPRRDEARTEYALCTYKDPDLSLDFKLEEALDILRTGWDLGSTENGEVLGLAGAIYKRRWQAHGRKEDLERSVNYYRRGYGRGPKQDNGYTAVNAAFVIDQLGWIERREALATGGDQTLADTRRNEARQIRETIIDSLGMDPDKVKNYWLAATLAEAYLGLAEPVEFARWFARAGQLVPDSWQLDSTLKQLTDICRIVEDVESADKLERSPTWKVLLELAGDRVPRPESVFLGKVGLALSGGGFRASLFHIGVLARLAEIDMLRHVEVISCVSGGSIIGAYYYLELKRLLEQNADGDLDRSDYIRLVDTISEQFLDGVQRNVRMRVGSNLFKNLWMLCSGLYSRTHRLGELYESELYSRIDDGCKNKPRTMTSLLVKPKSHEGRFEPKIHNWRRKNKVPTLILNATSLNTGHNWQFTASWMGESPAAIQPAVDANERLRRLYYDEQAPECHKAVRLGHAVAASSGVPGLFEPLALDGLYPGRTVRLVDGGVYDNQGVVGLLEQGCDVLLVSDACGQLESQPDPSANVLGVLARSNSVMMERIRAGEYGDLAGLRRSQRIRGFNFAHLKKDLNADPVDWIDCQDPYDASEFARARADRGTRTSYNVPKNHQRRLAGIRTDLDSFSEREAFALMESGYRMTKSGFPRAIQGVGGEIETEHNWRFHDISPELDDARDSTKFARVLDVASEIVLKAWKLSPGLRVLGWSLMAAGGGALLAGVYYWERPVTLSMERWQILTPILLALLGLAAGKRIMRIVKWRDALMHLAAKTAFAVSGFVLAWGHILVIDPIYHRHGRVPAPYGTQGSP